MIVRQSWESDHTSNVLICISLSDLRQKGLWKGSPNAHSLPCSSQPISTQDGGPNLKSWPARNSRSREMTLEPASRAAASRTMAASPVSPQKPRGAGVMSSQKWNQVHSLRFTAAGGMGSWFCGSGGPYDILLASPHMTTMRKCRLELFSRTVESESGVAGAVGPETVEGRAAYPWPSTR